MRALVTGATGFLGQHVVAALVAGGADVRALDRSDRFAADLPGAVEFVAADVVDLAAVRRAVAGCDAVFHLAGVYSYARADTALMRSVNVEGTRVVLEAALSTDVGAGARVRRRIVHTSSCATCGPVRGRAATERDLPPARELGVGYKRTKLEGERLALQAAWNGADVVVVNPTVPVGSGDRRPTPTGKMVDDVARGRARAYLARSALNVVSVADVAAGHVRAYEQGRAGERYLLGGENLSIREVFAAIAVAAGRPAPRVPIPWSAAYGAAWMASRALGAVGREPTLLVLDEARAGRVPHLFDDSKARSELGYRSRPAAEALADAARAMLDGR